MKGKEDASMTTPTKELRARQASRITLSETPPSEWQPSLRLLTTSEYEQMIAVGIFNEDDRVELLEGVIVEMSPKSALHAALTEDANDYFKARLKDKAVVRSQNPILLSDLSEPEPDLVIVAPPKQNYYSQHPKSSDVLLIMEIAESSLRLDRNTKGRLYARAGIIQYLILNVNEMEIEDYREPSADGYRRKQTYKAGQSFNLVAFPSIKIEVSDLLPPAQTIRTARKSKRGAKVGKASRIKVR
ncbi:MAG TPA: Uma2 family endonuclease [Pyrinomonadaceae bacterium]